MKNKICHGAKICAFLLLGCCELSHSALNDVSTGNPRVNQTGYVPAGDKFATLVNSSTQSLSWTLEKNGVVVLSGLTSPKGTNTASGESVHTIDFSSYTETGENFRLLVGSSYVSYPFTISTSLYTAMKYDAIKYFYHNRSGIEIETQYTGGGNGSFANNAKWARPAGHLNMSPNNGDFDVACWPGTCNYSLDVPYGWYDAGDHGKYVVNGGISVWKLLNMYERALYLGNNKDDFADGSLNIPESGNGIPDILDEVRWQLDFMLAMQVPDGETLAGMVHHKMHDESWTGLPLAPHLDSKNRYLTPPTTAATLNVAAVGAQCARLWKDIDPTFANQCLTVAEKAWTAAKTNTVMLYDDNYANGGGPYGDNDVSDEFAWAAAELYITTGKSTYASNINLNVSNTDYYWGGVNLPALMSLAVVPTTHTASQRTSARQTLIDVASARKNIINTQGYLVPIIDSEYVWGSNNNIANILTVLGLAYDFTGDASYARAVGNSLDYLLGRNPLSISYLTGYGEHAVAQPHHRFWAGALNGSYPWAPPGAFSGGPNKGIEDPIASVELAGCVSKPQTCFTDQIGSWSTNEITINWNSAFAWITAFYDDYSRSQATPVENLPPEAVITYSVDGNKITLSSENSSDSDGYISYCAWRFGDESPAVTECTVEHIYTAPGIFTVYLFVMDNDGAGHSTTVDITIDEEIVLNPVANFTEAVSNLNVQFDASASTNPVSGNLSYAWNFGDGTSGNGVSPTHTYTAAGNYIVSLVVTSANGGTDSVTRSVTAVAEPETGTSQCEYGIANEWSSGFVAYIRITNTGTSAING